MKHKFDLFRAGLSILIDLPDIDCRITIEQARRLTSYGHKTFFAHLRLYDFVLKNTKLSEVKRVYLPAAEPKAGEELIKAMVIYDSSVD